MTQTLGSYHYFFSKSISAVTAQDCASIWQLPSKKKNKNTRASKQALGLGSPTYGKQSERFLLFYIWDRVPCTDIVFDSISVQPEHCHYVMLQHQLC